MATVTMIHGTAPATDPKMNGSQSTPPSRSRLARSMSQPNRIIATFTHGDPDDRADVGDAGEHRD